MQYVKAADAADAVRHLVDAKGNGVVLAGGTDLLVQMKSRRVSPGVIVTGPDPIVNMTSGRLSAYRS